MVNFDTTFNLAIVNFDTEFKFKNNDSLDKLTKVNFDPVQCSG